MFAWKMRAAERSEPTEADREEEAGREEKKRDSERMSGRWRRRRREPETGRLLLYTSLVRFQGAE